jgi:hypothetical protein
MTMRLKLTVAAVALLGTLTALLIGALLSRIDNAGVKISFRGYEDYWGTDHPVLNAGSPEILHWPREARFMLKNRIDGVVGLWAGSRLEFKQPPGIVDVVPRCQGALGPQGEMGMTVALSGAERGQWRILVPVSDFRLLAHVETWVGRGAVSDWIREHQKTSPHWIASDWVSELPQRSSMPPVEAERDGDHPVRIMAPR